jgi:hypothetical protein
VVLLGTGPVSDGLRASLMLHDFVAGKLTRKELVPALRGTVFGVHEQLPLRSISQEETPARPTEARSLEALRGLSAAKRNQPVKMANADFDPLALEAEADDIELLRGMTEIALRFAGTLLRNLAVKEDGAVKVLKRSYPKVREAGKADDTLGVFLGVVEEYLYAPAQQGADTRARLDTVRKESFAAGEQQALRSAERTVRKGLADEILSLSEDLRRSVEGGAQPLEDRSRPR